MSVLLTDAYCLLAVLGMQLSVLELLVSSHSSLGFPLGIHTAQHLLEDNSQAVIDTISGSISATKSITSILLAAPARYETVFTNLEWVVLSCALSFSARLDVLTRGLRTCYLAQNLRQRLDFRHTLRQAILRLQSLATTEVDNGGDRDIFHHFLGRARAIDAWYLHRTGYTSLSTPVSMDAETAQERRTDAAEVYGPPTTGASISGHIGFQDLSFGDFFAAEIQEMDFDSYFDSVGFDPL